MHPALNILGSDSVPRKANIRMQDLRHNDYTTWRFPKD
jgi:hypothetical protein